ncbi:MAG: hypothetical protein AAFN44_16770 [Pseudomonadota bacterium]
MRHAKLSEYKFLKILRAYANGLGPKEAAAEAGISEKTIRATFSDLRSKVQDAAQSGKPVFGLGSQYLFEHGALTEKGEVFLESVTKSRVFESYKEKHAPRLKDPQEQEAFVFDLGMRVFTGLVVAEDEFYEVSPELKRSLELLDAMQIWIDLNEGVEGFEEEHHETLTRYRSLRRMADLVIEQRQIIALRNSGKHRYAGDKFYQDLRKFLLKHPIG